MVLLFGFTEVLTEVVRGATEEELKNRTKTEHYFLKEPLRRRTGGVVKCK